MFINLKFLFKLSSKNVTYITSSMCLVMCKRHLKHFYVKCVENDSNKEEEKTQNTWKRHKHFLVPSQRYQDSRYYLQNPTGPNYVMSFSNRAQRFTGSDYLDVDSPLKQILFHIGTNQIWDLKKAHFPMEPIQFHIKKKYRSHWNKSNFTFEEIPFQNETNPIFHLTKSHFTSVQSNFTME